MEKTDLLFQKSFDSMNHMKKIFNLKTFALGTLLFSSLFFSCMTAPKEIPEDLTAAQLIQRGQDAAASYNPAAANAYYVACIDRYKDDLKCYVEARYEIAQLRLKQKDYAVAKTMFQEILDIFDQPGAIYKIQPKYKKLAQIGLDKIKAVEEKKQIEAEQKKAKKEAKAQKAAQKKKTAEEVAE